jgi:hypothetical protein
MIRFIGSAARGKAVYVMMCLSLLGSFSYAGDGIEAVKYENLIPKFGASHSFSIAQADTKSAGKSKKGAKSNQPAQSNQSGSSTQTTPSTDSAQSTQSGETTQTPQIDVGELGFEKQELAVDPNLEKILAERRFKLKQHQFWGLATVGLLATALLTGEEGDAPAEHVIFGAATATMYGVSAYYSLTAPDLPSAVKPSGASLWHRRLAWVHGLGMIATPILGYMAKDKADNNEPIDGIEKHHKDVAAVTAATLAVAAILVSFDF